MDRKEILKRAMAWASECGEVQLGYFRSGRLHSQAKLNESDIVTEADRLSEEIILRHIAQEFPDHGVLGEETGVHEAHSDWRWVVDPLDGTTNFKAGLPIFAVSISLERCGESVLGVVYAPYLDEMFSAIKGEGAWLNSRPIRCSSVDRLECAVVCTGFPVSKGAVADNNLDNFSRVMPRVRGMRRLGSAAVDLCYVGAGFLDAFWELHLHQWDVSAAMLIASEAGASTSLMRPSSDLDVSVFASSPGLVAHLLPLLS